MVDVDEIVEDVKTEVSNVVENLDVNAVSNILCKLENRIQINLLYLDPVFKYKNKLIHIRLCPFLSNLHKESVQSF